MKRTRETLKLENLLSKKSVPGSTTSIIDNYTDEVQKIQLDPVTGQEVGFMHSILCQTSLPYRDPKGLSVWEKKQGNACLSIQTMKVKNPTSGEYQEVGLPYGTRARLILSHINTEAVINQSQRIYVQESMTRFIKTLGLSTDGRSIKSTKEQLKRLAASNISLSYSKDNLVVQDKTNIIKRLNIWFPKNENQKILWESYIDLSTDYFESLMEHAIPLDMRALSALSNNSMCLDIYCWLAQRLHRVSNKNGDFVPWVSLKEQFGFNYQNMYKFKQVFRENLIRVFQVYKESKKGVIPIGDKGFALYNSKPPILKNNIFLINAENKNS